MLNPTTFSNSFFTLAWCSNWMNIFLLKRRHCWYRFEKFRKCNHSQRSVLVYTKILFDTNHGYLIFMNWHTVHYEHISYYHYITSRKKYLNLKEITYDQRLNDVIIIKLSLGTNEYNVMFFMYCALQEYAFFINLNGNILFITRRRAWIVLWAKLVLGNICKYKCTLCMQLEIYVYNTIVIYITI